MTQKWNLQDIRPAEPRKRRIISQTSDEDSNPNQTTESHQSTSDVTIRRRRDDDDVPIKDGRKENKKNIIVLVSALVLIIGGIIGLSALMSKTTLTIYPDFRETTVSAEFIAYPERRDGLLSYEVMTISTEGEAQVAATGQEQVTEQAQGFIEIIKRTPGAERLIKNTRFRTTSGLIFRIQESVIVPGAITDSAGSLVPGTIRAEVFADSAGQEYNVPAGTRFDVPGFQESNLTELYNAIYAETREPITGGFNGPRYIIDDGLLATNKQQLHVDLRDELLGRLETEKPAGFIAFSGAVAFTYESLPSVRSGDDLVTIQEKAVLQIPLFKDSDFASFIAKETVPTYLREQVRITNIVDLIFSYSNQDMSAQNIANETSLQFSIVGRPQIVWEYDQVSLRTDLAGKAFTALPVVLSGYTGIKNASITGKPFWKRSFPEKGEDIQMMEIIEERN